LGQRVAALPIAGAYAEYVCLPQRELVPVPSGLDSAEAVSLVLNYVTAYQMLHRSAKARPGQRVLIHAAAGGVGSALLQLGRVANLQMYGTCSPWGASTVSELGGVPIDYRAVDFVQEIHRLTGEGADAVFDGIGGSHIWRSRAALRPGGTVVAYGLTGSLRGGRLASGQSGRRRRLSGVAIFGLYIAGGWLLPGRRRVVPYSIQWLKRVRPALFREDLIALFELLRQGKIRPLIARRFPLAQARDAQEFLGKGGVTGKVVLVCDEASLRSVTGAPRARRAPMRYILALSLHGPVADAITTDANVPGQLPLRRRRLPDRNRLSGADDMRLLDLPAQERPHGPSAREPLRVALRRRRADRISFPYDDRTSFLLPRGIRSVGHPRARHRRRGDGLMTVPRLPVD
jgi:NADPH2:quinone reductase